MVKTRSMGWLRVRLSYAVQRNRDLRQRRPRDGGMNPSGLGRASPAWMLNGRWASTPMPQPSRVSAAAEPSRCHGHGSGAVRRLRPVTGQRPAAVRSAAGIGGSSPVPSRRAVVVGPNLRSPCDRPVRGALRRSGRRWCRPDGWCANSPLVRRWPPCKRFYQGDVRFRCYSRRSCASGIPVPISIQLGVDDKMTERPAIALIWVVAVRCNSAGTVTNLLCG